MARTVRFDVLFTQKGKIDDEFVCHAEVLEEQLPACFIDGTGQTEKSALQIAQKKISLAIEAVLNNMKCVTQTLGNPQTGIREVIIRKKRDEKFVTKVEICNDYSTYVQGKKSAVPAINFFDNIEGNVRQMDSVIKTIEVPLMAIKLKELKRTKIVSL